MFNFPHNDFVDRIIAIAVIEDKTGLMKYIFLIYSMLLPSRRSTHTDQL